MNDDDSAKVVTSNSQTQGTNSKYDPDEDTKERIRNLASVGTALVQNVSGEDSFGTNYFLAIEALNAFNEGLSKLNLPPASAEGMNNLITYLRKKIEKRVKYADKQNEKPLV